MALRHRTTLAAAILTASLIAPLAGSSPIPAGRQPRRTGQDAQGASLLRPGWMWSSIPLNSALQPISLVVGDHARIQWFNPTSAHGGAKEHDLDPTLTGEEGGDNEHTVLEVDVGTSTPSVFTPSMWAGLTHAISRSGEDLWKTQAVEVWVNDKTPIHTQTHAHLHIDFGRVSEDAFWQTDSLPNNKLDSEDRNCDTKLDEGEDTGLDGVADKDEPGYNPVTNPDPNGDDYHYDPGKPDDYSKINGTEGNATGVPNARPDAEDLDLNCRLDLSNDYFEASIDLADTAYVVADVARDHMGNPAVKPDNGWRMFRIPVAAFVSYGSPSWDSIKHERLWIDAMTGPTNLQIGGIQLIPTPASELPVRVQMHPSHPNPFKEETTIEFDLSADGPVHLAIYDVRGRLVQELVRGFQPAGSHRAIWSVMGMVKSRADLVPSGVYFCRLEAGGKSTTRRIVLLR